MKIDNPFQIIDWEIKKFLLALMLVQIAVLTVIGVDMAGVRLPILREIVCFIYLTFIPGTVVLRALGMHNQGSIQSMLFTVGSSLTTLMFTGLLLNTLGPYAGISAPISVVPIIAALSIFVYVLCFICYLRDKKAGDPVAVDVNIAFSMPAIFLYILPFLAILGTYAMNFYNVNTLLAILILAIAGIVILVGFDKFIPKELYPLAILVIAIALLFHNSLISMYLNGWDIQNEKYYASQVITNGYWDSSTFSVLNAMLSIVMIAPVYSTVMNTDIVWVFKVVYPLLFALVPLGLYEVFKKQTDPKIAFMSSFFFMSLMVFFTEMLQLARQEIAELFLVLVIMLINDRSMDKAKWSSLFAIFSFSMVLSHYGLTYIFIASLAVVWALLYLSNKLHIKILDLSSQNRRLSLVLVLALITFCLIWYTTVASGNAFLTIITILERIKVSILSNFLNPNAAQGLDLIITGGSVSALHKVFLYLIMFTQGMIVLGIISMVFKREMLKTGAEYFTFAIVMILILIAGITVPFFASALNTSRLYQIALIFLAIFFVVGWLNVSMLFGRFAKGSTAIIPIAFRTLAIFLAIFLVFNTGLIFEAVKDVPMSYSLNRSVDTEVYHMAEVSGAEWVVNWRDAAPVDNTSNMYYLPPIYSDRMRLILLEGQRADQIFDISSETADDPASSYVYLGTYNIMNDQVLIAQLTGTVYRDTYVNASEFYENRSRIYANGGAEVYH